MHAKWLGVCAGAAALAVALYVRHRASSTERELSVAEGHARDLQMYNQALENDRFGSIFLNLYLVSGFNSTASPDGFCRAGCLHP
jgi:hypothetical protein